MLRKKVVFTLLLVVLVSSVWVGLVAAGQPKVTVCHKPGTAAEATLEIAAPAETAHLNHGDTQGECTGPQSDGCTTLNTLPPDPQPDPYYYFFAFSDLDFFPGETIHVDMTITNGNYISSESVAVLDSNGAELDEDSFDLVLPNQTELVAVNYVVVAGDNADGASASASSPNTGGFVLNDVNFSCTPAP